MDFSQIYPGDKQEHFANFKEDSGVEYQDMIFFDNEMRNCTSVSKLGVTCVYTPHGMTREAWEEGLLKFRESKAASTGSSSSKKKSTKKKKNKKK